MVEKAGAAMSRLKTKREDPKKSLIRSTACVGTYGDENQPNAL